MPRRLQASTWGNFQTGDVRGVKFNPNHVLFVCLGNICRSPAAEAVLRKLEPSLSCDSAGTASYHVGESPYGAMQWALKRRGIDVSDLRARQFSAADFNNFGLILAMDQNNFEANEALRPVGNQVPVYLFTDFAPTAEMDHVPDPYYTRDFEGCLDLLEQAAAGLKRALIDG